MQTILWSIVSEILADEIPPERIVPASSADSHYETPFAVLKSRGTIPSASRGSGGGVVGAEIWIHDIPGSYSTIRRIITSLTRGMQAETPRAGQHGAYLADIRWISVGPDLNDDGYGTICKMLSVDLIGVDGVHPDPVPPPQV